LFSQQVQLDGIVVSVLASGKAAMVKAASGFLDVHISLDFWIQTLSTSIGQKHFIHM
jgi:hypothetical protein